MIRLFVYCLLTVAVLASVPKLGRAQVSGNAFGGMNSSSGLFGSRSLGQGVGGRNGSAFGAAGGTPGNLVEQAQQGAGQVSGGERFLRDNRQPGQFVGADAADTSNFFSQLTGQGVGGLEQLGQNRGRQFTGNQNGQMSRKAPLRPRLSIGFKYPMPAQTQLGRQLQTRIAKLPRLEILAPVNVAIENQTAILTGRVATAHDREMIAQIALLEPGIAHVENQLLVGQPTEQAPPTSSAPQASQLPLTPPATPAR